MGPLLFLSFVLFVLVGRELAVVPLRMMVDLTTLHIININKYINH